MENSDLLNIKKELRAAMNGILSAKMREAGAPYKLVFGVELPRLQNIANEFQPSRSLAQQLWNENIRECKLLATMLMPPEEFLPEVADICLPCSDASVMRFPLHRPLVTTRSPVAGTFRPRASGPGTIVAPQCRPASKKSHHSCNIIFGIKINKIYFAFRSLIRNFETFVSKLLSLGNKNKQVLFCIPLTYS